MMSVLNEYKFSHFVASNFFTKVQEVPHKQKNGPTYMNYKMT